MAETKLRILLAGDSFAADWNSEILGWPNMLAKEFEVKNVAQAGISEYKILKQIEKNNPNEYDLVIVCHTSPFRIHTPLHPLERTGLHKDCDLIFNDLDHNRDDNNQSLVTALNWFKYHYDETFQEDIYKLMRKQINSLITVPYLAIDHSISSLPFKFEKEHLEFSTFWPRNRGKVNHYSDRGNQYVYNTVSKKLKAIK